MASDETVAPSARFGDKRELVKIADEIDAKAGIVHDPTATVEKVRAMMLEEGIRPEDNLFSRDIIRAKYADQNDEESKVAIQDPCMPLVVQPAERAALAELAKSINAEAGIAHDPTMTGERVREMMRAAGICPEDNILSRDIIRAKYADGENEE